MQILEHILKIRREKAKQEFWQTVGNQLATIWHCEIGIAKLALRNSQTTMHCSFVSQKRQNLSEISHCQIRNVVCEIRNHCQFRKCIAKFANLANRLRTDCEFRNPIKIPTVLPSDFVLRITFSSELRFRRFWYRWKA